MKQINNTLKQMLKDTQNNPYLALKEWVE
jgi:hypothetical protein